MTGGVRLEIELFRLALRDLTRLPLTVPSASDDLEARSVKFHPAVGAVIGLFGALVLEAGTGIWPGSAAVVIAVCLCVLVTGGRDERGFAAAVDGLAQGAHREDVLLRMTDGALGAVGALALGLAVALKLVILVTLPPLQAGAGLVLGMAAGRMATLHISATTHAARRTGMQGRLPGVTSHGYRVALFVTLAVACATIPAFGLWGVVSGLIGAVVLGQGFRAVFTRVVGGYTGESLGGVALMAELGTYLGAAAMM